MSSNGSATSTTWVDPDDEPELTEEWFAQAQIFRDGKVVRKGRPPLDRPKVPVTLRLDADIVERLRDSGPGWQTRVNDALRAMLQLIPASQSKP